MSGRPRTKAPPARRGPATKSVVGVVAVLALLALALFAWRFRGAPPPPPAVTVSSDPALADAASAYREGARLYAAGRPVQAVRYFRRVGTLTPGAPRDYHLQFAHLLVLAAQQSRTDLPQPATRSSLERVALMREALAQLDRAQELSSTPREIAEVHATRANAWRVWGFPWEGLIELRAAGDADPTWGEVVMAGDLVARRLRDPATPLPGLELEDIASK